MCIQFILAQPKHCDLLFQWINDKEVRNNSFHTDPIDYKEHVKWFQDKMTSPQCLLYICCAKEEPIGQIRIDIKEDTGWISYSVAKDFRGKGYGTNILRNLVNIFHLREKGIQKLVGRVKGENIASQRAFEKAGYHSFKTEAYIEYYRLLSEEKTD